MQAQIVLGPYSGPMSVRAAASFAQSRTAGSAPSTTKQQSGGRVGLFVLAVIALLAFGGIGAAVAIHLYSPKPPPASAPVDPSRDPPQKTELTQPL